MFNYPVTPARNQQADMYQSPTPTSGLVRGALGSLYGSQELEPINMEHENAKGQGCHECCGDIKILKQEIQELRTEMDQLKKKLKSNKKQNQEQVSDASLESNSSSEGNSNGHTQENLVDKIRNVSSLTDAVRILLFEMFTIEELLTSSVCGKATLKTMCDGKVKKGLDSERRQLLEAILVKKFDASLQQVRSKVRDRLKLVRRNYGKTEQS